ncbi:MAG: serine hydrolase domain-containing protein [Ignavibacteriota bacterium]|nr:serine hydrolase [Ignavibacteriota bacterium]
MKKYLLIFLFVAFYSNGQSFDFTKVDNLILNGISNKYFPGAALIIGNKTDIMYEKYFGGFTYDDNDQGVTENSIYDLASVTKVIATTSAVMKLYESGLLDLDTKVSYYFPEFAVNGKENITVRNLLLHNSGLKAWVPFYQTCKNKADVVNTIFTIGLEYETGSKFLYSDLNFITLGLIVEKISGLSLAEYCRKEVFYPLKMDNTFFTPDQKVLNNVVPTEFDANWRKRQLKGEVHDESAALLDGISGNAGLFSNARDLYTLMRVLQNNGKYNNPYSRGIKQESLFKEETVNLFLSKYITGGYASTRAMGWDTKQEPVGKYRSQCGELISANCFGHTGYTGTSVWCDRDRDIVVIFLTNRVYPSRGNDGIKEIRPELHNLIIKTLTNK